MLSWFVRRGLWDFFALIKFFFAKPENIQLPKAKWGHIEPKPMGKAISGVPLQQGDGLFARPDPTG